MSNYYIYKCEQDKVLVKILSGQYVDTVFRINFIEIEPNILQPERNTTTTINYDVLSSVNNIDKKFDDEICDLVLNILESTSMEILKKIVLFKSI